MFTTTSHEIADGIHRLSTHVPDVAPPTGLTFNQFLVVADEPLLFHCGQRMLFPSVAEAVGRIIPVESLRWIAFGHVEADETGALNEWLAAVPSAQATHGALGCMVSLDDMATRPPRPLGDGEVIDLGGKRVRQLPTPHVPHGWDAELLFEETTGTLFCGDLFAQPGNSSALVHDADLVGPAIATDEVFGATCLTARTAPTIRGLADLDPRTLALMHGPSFAGDATRALHDLAGEYELQFQNTQEVPA